MPQSPDLRRQFDEWIEQRVQELEDDGAYIKSKDIKHNGAQADVVVRLKLPRRAVNDE